MSSGECVASSISRSPESSCHSPTPMSSAPVEGLLAVEREDPVPVFGGRRREQGVAPRGEPPRGLVFRGGEKRGASLDETAGPVEFEALGEARQVSGGRSARRADELEDPDRLLLALDAQPVELARQHPAVGG